MYLQATTSGNKIFVEIVRPDAEDVGGAGVLGGFLEFKAVTELSPPVKISKKNK